MLQKFITDILGTSAIEWCAVILLLAYVALAARSSWWCWPAGIAGSALYIYINYDYKLYLDSILQVYYVIAGAYGWYAWKFETRTGEELPVRRAGSNTLIACIILPAVLMIPAGFLQKQYTDSPVPWLDAGLTLFSFTATWMTTRKIFENWLFWIVIDAVYVYLYFSRQLPLTAVLYFIYTIVAVYGHFQWKKMLRQSGA